jgi:formate dehydrogenase major subunit
MLVYVEGGKVINVEGDPECPLSEGLLCPKGEAPLEFLYRPDRLKQPLERLGDIGEGRCGGALPGMRP